MDPELEAGASPEKARGFLSVLVDVYLSPARAFEALARHPGFWTAGLLFLLVQGAFLAVWLQRVDLVEFMRAQAEAAGRTPPPASAAAAAVGFIKFSIIASVVVVMPLMLLALAGLFLFVFDFLLGCELRYRQCLSVVAHAYAATALVTAPLTLLVLALKGDWNLDPPSALQANLTILLDRTAVARPLYSLAGSLDLFSFWLMSLLSIGLGKAARRPTATAAAAVVSLWALYVLAKVGWAALF